MTSSNSVGSAAHDILLELVHDRKPVLRREGEDPVDVNLKDEISGHEQRGRALPHHHLERAFQLVATVCLDRLQCHAERLGARSTNTPGTILRDRHIPEERRGELEDAVDVLPEGRRPYPLSPRDVRHLAKSDPRRDGAGWPADRPYTNSLPYVRLSCCRPPALRSGPSTSVTCTTSIGASCGWSLLTDRTAHSDEHSRSQPQEQVTSQRGFSVLVKDHGPPPPPQPPATNPRPAR